MVYTLVVTFLVLALTAAVYAAAGGVTLQSGRFRLSEAARRHLGVILSAVLLLLATRWYLSGFGLLINSEFQLSRDLRIRRR